MKKPLLPHLLTASLLSGALVMSSAAYSSNPLRLNTALQEGSGYFRVLINPGSPPSDPTCEDDMKNMLERASAEFLVAYTPPDPSETFNASISDCLSNIQSFSIDLPFADVLGFDFTSLLDGLMGDLMDAVMTKACESATSSWKSAIDNASQTIQSGVNQFGISEIDWAIK